MMIVYVDMLGLIYDWCIFMQFVEYFGIGIYGGLWVGLSLKIFNMWGFCNDVVFVLCGINVFVVCWFGGCFVDEYYWCEGIGLKNKCLVKINMYWGGVIEFNIVGMYEFMDLVGQFGVEFYIVGNVGNGILQEMVEWVEYMIVFVGMLVDECAKNGYKVLWMVLYFGVGNELWGCGGNMWFEYVVDLMWCYVIFIKVFKGMWIMKIVSGVNVEDYCWIEVMMCEVLFQVDVLLLYYYIIFGGGWLLCVLVMVFDEVGWVDMLFEMLCMDELIIKYSVIMDKVDLQKKLWLVVDEWGIWYVGDFGINLGFLCQQNMLCDVLVVVINFNIFVKYVDCVKMIVIVQMVNVLQVMVLIDGVKMVLMLIYYVFVMYKLYMDGIVLLIDVKLLWYNKDKWVMFVVSVLVVCGKDGVVWIVFVNFDLNKLVIIMMMLVGVIVSGVMGQVLIVLVMIVFNSFDVLDVVKLVVFIGVMLLGGMLIVMLLLKFVVMLELC